jgi:hypothetical protein
MIHPGGKVGGAQLGQCRVRGGIPVRIDPVRLDAGVPEIPIDVVRRRRGDSDQGGAHENSRPEDPPPRTTEERESASAEKKPEKETDGARQEGNPDEALDRFERSRV